MARKLKSKVLNEINNEARREILEVIKELREKAEDLSGLTFRFNDNSTSIIAANNFAVETDAKAKLIAAQIQDGIVVEEAPKPAEEPVKEKVE